MQKIKNNIYKFRDKKLFIVAFIGFVVSLSTFLFYTLIYLPWDFHNNFMPYKNVYTIYVLIEFIWFRFLHYWTTISNLIILFAFFFFIIFYIFNVNVKSTTILKYITLYITITMTIFVFILLPIFLLSLIQNMDTVSSLNLPLYLPWNLSLHIICPVIFIFYFLSFLKVNKNKKIFKINGMFFYLRGMCVPLLYVLYAILINFIWINGYHSVYGTITNFNNDFFLTNYPGQNAIYESGSLFNIIYVVIALYLFVFVLAGINYIEEKIIFSNINLNKNKVVKSLLLI